MRNSGLNEAQAGIKIAGRNINNLRYIRSEAPASTGEESGEGPEQLAWGLEFPEATRAGP